MQLTIKNQCYIVYINQCNKKKINVTIKNQCYIRHTNQRIWKKSMFNRIYINQINWIKSMLYGTTKPMQPKQTQDVETQKLSR